MPTAAVKAPKAVKTPKAKPTPPPLSFYRFTVEQYHRMAAEGVLTANDRVELLDGLIVDKMTHNPPHANALTRINRLLLRMLPEEWLLRVQLPITVRTSEPEPDLAIVAGPEDRYDARHPGPKDVAILIEVADSTLLEDRRHKSQLYAREKILEYWIVNLIEERIEVYTRPQAGRTPGYRQRADFGLADQVPLILKGKEIGRIAARSLLRR